MTQAGVLEPVFRRLKTSPLTLEQLWSDYASQWHLLGWSIEQVSLYLKCLPNIQINSQADGEIAFELADTASASSINLADELVALLIKVGRPTPLAHLLSKFPPGLIVTEQMLRTAAQQDARLELKGPLLKLA